MLEVKQVLWHHMYKCQIYIYIYINILLAMYSIDNIQTNSLFSLRPRSPLFRLIGILSLMSIFSHAFLTFSMRPSPYTQSWCFVSRLCITSLLIWFMFDVIWTFFVIISPIWRDCVKFVGACVYIVFLYGFLVETLIL